MLAYLLAWALLSSFVMSVSLVRASTSLATASSISGVGKARRVTRSTLMTERYEGATGPLRWAFSLSLHSIALLLAGLRIRNQNPLFKQLHDPLPRHLVWIVGGTATR